MIKRTRRINQIRTLLSRYPVVAVIGARQIGKTTLAKQLAMTVSSQTTWFDLEDPVDLTQLDEPGLVLRNLKGLVVIDEIQRKPALFQIIRVLVDMQHSRRKFLILGSASPELLKGSSESLAGRIAYYTLNGLSIKETGVVNLDKLWIRGGFPRSYLAQSDKTSVEWRKEFINTFLERDIPQLGIRISSTALRRFWVMLANYHGQIWNSSEFGRSFGVADTTVRGYLDILTSTFVVRQLQPWHENISKRQVKSPKVYIRDSGILHALLGLATKKDVMMHPKLGASWEGFALESVIEYTSARPEECFFWATHGGAELDLLIVRGNKRIGFEFKRTETPRITSSIKNALSDLNLAKLYLIHAGVKSYPLSKKAHAISIFEISKHIK
ncbi:MAG: ATP-binding protein [Planctomycetes bacterium]|nr:ATP-binding protein [Planctomycetota bacterium]